MSHVDTMIRSGRLSRLVPANLFAHWRVTASMLASSGAARGLEQIIGLERTRGSGSIAAGGDRMLIRY